MGEGATQVAIPVPLSPLLSCAPRAKACGCEAIREADAGPAIDHQANWGGGPAVRQGGVESDLWRLRAVSRPSPGPCDFLVV